MYYNTDINEILLESIKLLIVTKQIILLMVLDIDKLSIFVFLY